MTDYSKALRDKALLFLARREHGRAELRQKLLSSTLAPEDCDPLAVDALLTALVASDLQSDARYVELYVRTRLHAGYGPRSIRCALEKKSIGPDLIEDALSSTPQAWSDQISSVWLKKYDGKKPVTKKEYARQCRFLSHRGFSSEMISHLKLFEAIEHDK